MLAEIAGPTDPNAPMSGVGNMCGGLGRRNPAPDDQPDTEPDHIPTETERLSRAASH